MIEKYFRAGIRYKWTKPNDSIGVLDGTMVDSKQAATPLIYDGLDGQLLDPLLRQVHVSTLGLSMRVPIQYAWLDYAPGRTARLPIGPYDVLSGYMSGCIIAHWTDKGIRCAGHVGTMERPDVDRLVKRTFAFAMPKDTKGFDPFRAWPTSEIADIARQVKPTKAEPFRPQQKILALVTTHGEFYSILMLSHPNHAWCAAGIKKVPPIDHDTLKLRMLRDP